MTAPTGRRPDPTDELKHLKDFQRLTVDRVFQRLYLDERPTRRFLIADEVGLGKTLVARGVIARTIAHLWDTVDRIDVVYLCSNSDIARQNVARLTPSGCEKMTESPRITLLPITAHGMSSRKVNIIPLTPGTSLKVSNSLGLKKERALLLHLVKDHWQLDHLGACRLFTGNAGLQKFKAYVKAFTTEHTIDPELKGAFLTSLDTYCVEQKARGERTLRERLCSLVDNYRNERQRSGELAAEQRAVIGLLRQLLGRSCIRSLEPDLIILDEFQRFKDLLGGDDPAAEMARQLFEYEDETTQARVLLLSATPYKMYTTPDEAGGESHYDDFVRTARFLLHEEPEKVEELAQSLKEYRSELFRAAHDGLDRLTGIRQRLETILRSVMVRTERLAVTPDRSGMLSERPVTGVALEARDITSYREAQSLARHVDHPDALEYWKAAPWLLNFMEDYKLSREFDAVVKDDPTDAELRELIEASPHALLRWDDVAAYRRLDPAHGRLRWLVHHVLDGGLWRLLWLPPTLPYYRLAPEVQAIQESSPSKTLIFSAWRVVPRVIASIVSHEAERRLYSGVEGEDADLTGAPDRLGNLLRVGRREGSVAGLTALALLYPSGWMARNCDPREISASLADPDGEAPTLERVLEEAERRIQPLLARVTEVDAERTAPDESWYWAAPILMDLAGGGDAARRWFAEDLSSIWFGSASRRRPSRASEDEDEDDEETAPLEDASGSSEDEHSSFADFVARVRELVAGKHPGGTPPADLARVLARMAVAGPATAVLRSLARVIGAQHLDDASLRSAAARVGASFRTLFNQPDATAAVRAMSAPSDYWKQCLEYAAGSGMQGMLDEYAHMLMSEAGLHAVDAALAATSIADRLSAVVGIRRASVGAQHFHVTDGHVHRDRKQMRSRFAMRFGEERADESGDNLRADDVRQAFNSPFAPFVLATTSVGQEGLDFHFYCHSVVHWNLPPNPVDLEQREGRVHRFKGLAVRKNVSRAHSTAWRLERDGDPWRSTFQAAIDARTVGENDLVPFWVYPLEGGASIERHVPNYTLSRDVERFRALREALAVYRMVFGQPRQEELMAYLVRTVAPERIRELAERLQVSLSPSGIE